MRGPAYRHVDRILWCLGRFIAGVFTMKQDDWEEPLELQRDAASMLKAKEGAGIEVTIRQRVELSVILGCPFCKQEFSMISRPLPPIVHCPYCGKAVKLTMAEWPEVVDEKDVITNFEAT